MIKNKGSAFRYRVVYNAPFDLPRPIEVTLTKKASEKQLPHVVIHLMHKAKGFSTDPNFSAFTRDQFKCIANGLNSLVNEMRKQNSSRIELVHDRVHVIRSEINLKGFD